MNLILKKQQTCYHLSQIRMEYQNLHTMIYRKLESRILYFKTFNLINRDYS
jgi:hypothetical protein